MPVKTMDATGLAVWITSSEEKKRDSLKQYSFCSLKNLYLHFDANFRGTKTEAISGIHDKLLTMSSDDINSLSTSLEWGELPDLGNVPGFVGPSAASDVSSVASGQPAPDAVEVVDDQMDSHAATSLDEVDRELELQTLLQVRERERLKRARLDKLEEDNKKLRLSLSTSLGQTPLGPPTTSPSPYDYCSAGLLQRAASSSKGDIPVLSNLVGTSIVSTPMASSSTTPARPGLCQRIADLRKSQLAVGEVPSVVRFAESELWRDFEAGRKFLEGGVCCFCCFYWDWGGL